MLIQILIDNPNSWIIPYANKLVSQIRKLGHKVLIVHKHKCVTPGDILILLSCERKFNNLKLNKYNIVIHESDLPLGKGWSPMTWQIIEGKSTIPITLFEAAEEIDAGQIFLQKEIFLEGHELIGEIRDIQGNTTIELVLDFVKNVDNISGRIQKGESTFYAKRTIYDSKLDVKLSLADQFNLLRVCDNERYPAWFIINDKKYILKIEKA